MRRIIVDIILFAGIFALFALHTYEFLPAPLQLVALKAMLVSAGILHAHIVRKLIFSKVDWQATTLRGSHYVSIVFYIVIPISYAFGG